MKTSRFGVALAILTIALTVTTGAAANEPSCGLNTGEAATGEPILVGGINGNAPPGDFSGGTDAAAAYFKCVNENGGINGRPIEGASPVWR